MDGRAWKAAVHGWLRLDTTEGPHFHFSLSCIGEGNGNPLQCSCLENPGDRGSWWASVYGVAQSQTRLTRLSSSSRMDGIKSGCVWAEGCLDVESEMSRSDQVFPDPLTLDEAASLSLPGLTDTKGTIAFKRFFWGSVRYYVLLLITMRLIDAII